MTRSARGVAGFVTVAMFVAMWPLTTRAGLQTAPSAGAPAPAEIDALVTRVVDAAREYKNTFLNLVVEETRLTELFDESGRLDKRRAVVSDLIVYTSHDSRSTAEYRDVRSVDGKPVAKRNTRALELLTRAPQSTSVEKELDLINRESQRYDLEFKFFGFTINQAGLELQTREKYRIDWGGRDQIGGHDVLILDYQDMTRDKTRMNAAFYTHSGFSSSFYSCRLWIDAASAQLRRSRCELEGIHPELTEPVTIFRTESAYTESRFGILVPERAVYEWYETAEQKKNQPPKYFRRARATSTLGVFRQFEVETQQTIGTPR
jgi:hypothetical protein